MASVAIKIAAAEVGLFVDKSEITHKNRRFDDLSDEELVLRVREEADKLMLQFESKIVDVTPPIAGKASRVRFRG